MARGAVGRRALSDAQLLAAIRSDLVRSPFQGEGHRKVHARLRILDDIRVSRTRVLRVMRAQGLLSPHRGRHGARTRPTACCSRPTTDGSGPSRPSTTGTPKLFAVEPCYVVFSICRNSAWGYVVLEAMAAGLSCCGHAGRSAQRR